MRQDPNEFSFQFFPFIGWKKWSLFCFGQFFYGWLFIFCNSGTHSGKILCWWVCCCAHCVRGWLLFYLPDDHELWGHWKSSGILQKETACHQKNMWHNTTIQVMPWPGRKRHRCHSRLDQSIWHLRPTWEDAIQTLQNQNIEWLVDMLMNKKTIFAKQGINLCWLWRGNPHFTEELYYT
jgi:hypothetical protein